MKKEIIPLWACPCLTSEMLIHFSYTDYNSLNEFLKECSYETILKVLFNKNCSYDILEAKYNEACNLMKDNDFFAVSYKIDDCYNIKITKEIQIFYTDDLFEYKGEKLFPWNYPQHITCLGYRQNYSDEEIIDDFMNLNLLLWYEKYCLGLGDALSISLNDIVLRDNRYTVKDNFCILLDSHICFARGDKNTYIADTWWYTDEEILNDLVSFPICEFGLKYKAFWCL